MKVFSNLQFQNSGPALEFLTNFPVTPVDGQMALVDGVVYIYTTLAGFKTWYPLSNETSYFVHAQGLESLTWTINHGLDTGDFIFFVYDHENKLIQPIYEFIDNNSFKLNFSSAKKGKAVVFVAAQKYVPALPQNSTITTVTELPLASVALFNAIVFVTGDSAYVCTSNEVNPTLDNQCFWVQL